MKRKIFSLLLITALLCALLCSCSSYEAPEWEIYADEWHNFRGTEQNLAVTDAKTPKTSKEANLDWVFRADTRPAGLLSVDDFIVVFAGNAIYKLDAETGNIVSSAELSGASQYSSVSPTYRDGVLYIALDGEMIQAISFDTLETLWTYSGTFGGQALSPVLVTDGIVCTGFWNGETEDANFVMLSTSGEYIASAAQKGGFYLAGAVAAGDYIIVSSDNGAGPADANAESTLYMLDKTGFVTDTVSLIGDGRSSCVYLDGRVYTATKSGILYSVEVSDDKFGEIRTADLGGECTAPPVIYDHYAFVGTSAKKVLMIDTDTIEIVSEVEMDAYPQASMLLSDAYAEDTCCVYLYGGLNAQPGSLFVVKADMAKEKMTADVLFEPVGYENFCLSSVICDGDGALYYGNDSGCVFKISKK